MALDEAGAFRGLSKVELIEGELLTMSPHHHPHVYAKSQLAFRLHDALRAARSELVPLIEGAVKMSDFDATEPDIVLCRPARWAKLIPGHEIRLAVEIADSSLAFDLREKTALYARHRIPEYWVLGIPTATLHQFWAPSEERYLESRTINIGGRIESITIAGLAVESDGLI